MPIISTPTDLTAYLRALALQVPGVRQVITGEGSRQEESTATVARYPQVLIETPEATIPAGQDQKVLSTRLYIFDSPGTSRQTDEDTATERAYRIAEDIIFAIHAHETSDLFDFEVTQEQIEISPIIARGSDQLRGWMMEVGFAVSQSCGSYDPDQFFFPAFTWTNDTPEKPTGTTITVTDMSIDTTDDGCTKTWWYKEDHNPGAATEFDPYDEASIFIDFDDFDPPHVIEIWCRMVSASGITLWAYARVLGEWADAPDSGSSTSIIPTYPV